MLRHVLHAKTHWLLSVASLGICLLQTRWATVSGTHESDSQPWMCSGLEHFVTAQCGPCITTNQCSKDMFCCPYTKLCVSSPQTECFGAKASCSPPVDSGNRDEWTKHCAAKIEHWITCPSQRSPSASRSNLAHLSTAQPLDATEEVTAPTRKATAATSSKKTSATKTRCYTIEEKSKKTVHTTTSRRTTTEETVSTTTPQESDDRSASEEAELPNWLCGGRERFLTNPCDRCVNSFQCGADMYCCPRMKRCVPYSNYACPTPMADCDPPTHSSRKEDWDKYCQVDIQTWMTCPSRRHVPVAAEDNKPWRCGGAVDFLTEECNHCAHHDQCGNGMLCCPRAKVCLYDSNSSCSGRSADCYPSVATDDEDIWKKNCKADIRTWVICSPGDIRLAVDHDREASKPSILETTSVGRASLEAPDHAAFSSLVSSFVLASVISVLL